MAVISALIGLSLAVGVTAPPQLDSNWTVYLRRAGPVQIGMRVSEVRSVLQDPEAFLAYVDKEPDDSKCAYLQSSRIPRSLGLMFQSARLVRIDVIDEGIRTASGAQVGDTEEKIKRLYPSRIRVERHFYDDNGHYLNYTPADRVDRKYGMVFETDGQKVTSFRTGTRSAIRLVEGCS